MTEVVERGKALTGEEALSGVFDFRFGATSTPPLDKGTCLRGEVVEAGTRATSLPGLVAIAVERRATGLSLVGEAGPSSTAWCLLYTTGSARGGRLAASPADLGRGSKLGLNRERLAFVGDRKEARRGLMRGASMSNILS